ncbi:MAG TPA: hypothetical protein VIO64_06985 [Pseudobacteroides sp.]|uniref:hypothetical protein n=1 Tax=Pseudobacteroides sp. TaxID=1968840 RepID=UPI002F9431DC
MKKGRIILSLLVICIFAAGLSGIAQAEKRSIFIGDVIELKVTSQNITIEELRDKFKDFEIIDIKENDDSFLLALRSFEPGEKTVRIGNREVKINVKSTLKELKREGIYEGDTLPVAAGSSIGWKYVLFAFIGITLVTGGFNLWWLLKRRKKSRMDPYGLFKMQAKGVSLDDRDYLVQLTKSFKEYIETVYSCTIRGKTTSELIKELSSIPDLQPVLPAIQNWLSEGDCFKYMGVSAKQEKKQELLDWLLELVRKIDYAKEVKSS